jgi:hypothetical protein
MHRSLLTVPVLGALLAGCYGPSYDGFTCNTAPRLCPEAMICVPGAEASSCLPADTAPAPEIKVTISPTTVQFVPTSLATQALTVPTTLQVSVTIANFAIDAEHAGSLPNEARFGHYHIYLDDQANFSGNFFPGLALTLAVPVNHDAAPFKNAQAGTHQLIVSLANNNHTEIQPPVRAETTLVILP